MTAQEYAFVAVAVIGSISAVAVVTARNVVHAALYLVVTLAAVGVTFLLLGAEFIGWVQILIYVGAIVILFLFGLMLTKAPIGRDALDYQNRTVGAVVGAADVRRARLADRPRVAGLVGTPVPGSRRATRPCSARRSSATTCCRSRPCRSCCSPR